jgi:hypothetical protein
LLIRADLRKKKKKKKTLIFKTNKTRNTTIKNSNRSGRDDGHWPVLARSGGDGRHSTLTGRQNWLELLHMAKKHLKKHKESNGKIGRRGGGGGGGGGGGEGRRDLS